MITPTQFFNAALAIAPLVHDVAEFFATGKKATWLSTGKLPDTLLSELAIAQRDTEFKEAQKGK